VPGHRFAFAVPAAVPGTDRLCCTIVSGKENVHCAVLDVREEIPGQPWPPDDMPAEMREVCAGFELPEKTGQAAASAVINADAGAVWETLWASDAAQLIDPETFVWAGTVPGTPQRAVGELQCTVHRHPDDRFTAVVHVVKELAGEQRAVTQAMAEAYKDSIETASARPPARRAEAVVEGAGHIYPNGLVVTRYQLQTSQYRL
jgi:hypothetical protein